jgi:hypothetical protein
MSQTTESLTTASAKPISPLRRRMIEDMTVRGFGEKTQSDYIRHVTNPALKYQTWGYQAA